VNLITSQVEAQPECPIHLVQLLVVLQHYADVVAVVVALVN
jgi:hypothetical protein